MTILLGILIYFAAWSVFMLLVFPGLLATLLYQMRLRPMATRYAAWASKYWPSPAQRPYCAMLTANIYAQADDKVHAAEYADLGIALSEPLLHMPKIRVTYTLCINIRGQSALNAGRYAEAFDSFYRPLRMNLEHRKYVPLFLSNCAASLYSLGKFEETIEYAGRALAQDASAQTTVTILSHHNTALALMELGRPAEALAASELAVAVNVPRVSRYHLMAVILHAQLLALAGDREASEKLFAEVATHTSAPDLSLKQRLYGMRGVTRWEQGRLGEAEADLRLGLEGPSVAPQCLYHLALIADKQGQTAQAQEWRERLLREVPESFHAERVRQARGTGVV